MDVLFFLKDRTRLIRQYHKVAALPFAETIRKIEAGEEPFVPPYSEDGEPPFIMEWTEARELLEVTGRCCLSILAGSLQLYLKTWEADLGLECGVKEFKSAAGAGGWWLRYRDCLADRIGIDWASCPADLAVVEQVVLARNRDQHPEQITSLRTTHSGKDMERYPNPFFASEHEAELFSDGEGPQLFMSRSLIVPREKLMTAIREVEVLCEWLEEKMFDAKYPLRHEKN